MKENQLGSYHEKRLKDQGYFEWFERIKVESEYIRNEKDETDIDGECSNWLIFMNETILKDIACDRTDCHT